MDSKEGFRALFEHANEGIVVTDSKGVIVKVNPSAEKLFGYDENELLGERVEILVPRDAAHKHVKHREGYSKNPHPRSMGVGLDLQGKRKDDSQFPVELSLSPLVIDNEKFVIAFIVDNSFRKKQESELRKINLGLEKRVEDRTLMLREAIIELEKSREEIFQALEKEKELNDLKSRFVSMASHEFRTPLSTILSSVSLLGRYNTPETADKRDKHVTRIKSTVGHLTDILNDLLSLSKLEEEVMHNHPVDFNIVDFSEEIVQNMQGLCKDRQQIMYSHTGNINVSLDEKFLRHILMNLLSNAIKFSEEGTIVKLITNSEKDSLTVVVQDQGMGIDKKDQKQLFDRFFRGENVMNIPGTGLGLSIVTKYLELMEGTIELESELNKGTIFTIKLPIK